MDHSYKTSFNSLTTLSSTTQVLIIGTLTPKKGQDAGYFYSSPSNRMYEILDHCFETPKGQPTLLEIKASRNDKDYVKRMMGALSNRGIAFLDTIATATSPDDSAADKDIKNINLDYESFKNVDPKKLLVICNSRLAERHLKKILLTNDPSKKDILYPNGESPFIKYIPQTTRGRKGITFDKLKSLWKEVIDTHIK